MNDENQNELINTIAETNFRGQGIKFGIKPDDRRRHMYIIGKTGMGKSVLQENMIYRDIINGNGVAVVDPHGDLVEHALEFIPSNRINDVIYFNPADLEYPISFNVLEKVDVSYHHLVASGLIQIFKKLWADTWGPRLEYLLRNAILALLEYPDSTLLGVTRILIDKEYRKKVLAKVKDPVVKSFWLDEYARYTDKFQVEAIAPIQNKVGAFLSTSLIRNVVGQVKSAINVREIMDNKKILLLNLSKGRIGEDASQMLGAMMITKIQLAAMSRVDIAEDERKDFYLYVDEFQNFATESFAQILSEARKYRLNLVIAHQYISQLTDEVRDAVFGNVGTMISFRVGAQDAEELVKEYAPRFDEEDIVNLPKFQIYLKLMIDGVASDAFSAKTLPPLSTHEDNAQKIIDVSRERYATKKEIVEDKISRWAGIEPPEREIFAPESKDLAKKEQNIKEENIKENIGGKRGINFVQLLKDEGKKQYVEKKQDFREIQKQKEDEIERRMNEAEQHAKQMEADAQKFHIVNCAECGDETRIYFKPDGKRPIYCKKCLKKIKQRKQQFTDIKQKPAQIKIVKDDQPEQELSLAEAISMGQKQFKDKKDRREQQPKSKPKQTQSNYQAPVPPPIPKKEEKQQPKQDKTAAEPKQNKELETKKQDNKAIKPGQVIKF